MSRLEVDMDRYQDQLKIDKNNLDEEIIRQAEKFHEISSAYVESVSRRDMLYESLKETDADLNLRVRREAEEEGKKVTEAIIGSLVLTHPEHKEAFNQYQETKAEAAQLEVLRDAYLQRSYMLRDLVQLHVAGYYMDSSVGASVATTKNAQEARYTENRNRIRNRLKSKH